MIGALWTGISGLAAQQTALDNESHNISNVNTVGYKASRVSFADQMYQNRIGKGTKIVDTEKLYIQGNIKTTGVEFDMALQGDGFFCVSDTRGAGMAETYYTRAGNFRMGDNGTLQDASGNAVQGWAMTKLTETDVVSTDPNVKRFTTAFVSLGASEIIRNSNSIQTITSKMTDYKETAKADSKDIFTGAGWKTKSSKINDVEAIVNSYRRALTEYKNQPNGASITPGIYKNIIDFSPGLRNLNSGGDTISVYIDGTKFTQSWDTDLRTTLRAFSDQLSSKIKGVTAYITDNKEMNSPFPRTPTDTKGYFSIESLVPGRNLTISQMSITSSAGVSTPGLLGDSIKIDSGSGYAAVTAARDALKKAVTGKQQDVFVPEEILKFRERITTNATTGLTTVDDVVHINQDFKYSIAIYDPVEKQNIVVPDIDKNGAAEPLEITIKDGKTKEEAVDYMVKKINGWKFVDANDAIGTEDLSDAKKTQLRYYVKAYNINGNLVIETLNKNYELEFSSNMQGKARTSEVKKLTLKAPDTGATGEVKFLGVTLQDEIAATTAVAEDLTANPPKLAIPVIPKSEAFVTTGASAADIAREVNKRKSHIIKQWNETAGTKKIDTISVSGTDVTIRYRDDVGDVNDLDHNANTLSGGITFVEMELTKGAEGIEEDKLKSASQSGRQGASAELLEITTVVEQTGARGELQLKLDSLGISNSPFGKFTVDRSGLITMFQDGVKFAVGQVAIAMFNDNRGLEPIGDNLLRSNGRSGTPIFNLNNNKAAKVESTRLELSTADLSESLVNLMVFQRAFEANAKSITTADAILNTLINLKR
jgi:flagellar hook protein FlgE